MRAPRQPGYKATVKSFDEAAVRKAAGSEIEIIRDGAFIAFLSKSERAVSLAVSAAEQRVQWDDARAGQPPNFTEPAALKALPATPWEGGAPPPEPSNRRQHKASYGRPFIAHGSMGPSHGVARFADGVLTVWTYAQGVYPIRGVLARVTGLAPEAIRSSTRRAPAATATTDRTMRPATLPRSRCGAQERRSACNGGARTSSAMSRPGTAMQIDVSGEIDASGRLVDFSTEIWSGPHIGRGGSAGRGCARSRHAAATAHDHARI